MAGVVIIQAKSESDVPMTVALSALFAEVQTELQDTGIRWVTAELLAYYNEALVVTVTERPDTNAVTSTFTPVAGAAQTLPATALGFIDIAANATGNRRNITKVDKYLLDSFEPAWQSGTQKAEIMHFTYDKLTPRKFYLYPPATTAARIELITGDYPTLAASVTGNLPLQDWAAPAIKCYMKFKAWSKDAETAGNAALAKAHIDLYQSLLGIQLSASTSAVAAT